MENLGPLGGLVAGAGFVVSAAIALIALVTARSPWAPEVPGLKNYAVRIYGVVIGAAVVGLFVDSLATAPNVRHVTFTIISSGTGVAFGLVYLFLHQLLIFHCEGDRQHVVKGLVLRPNAKLVLGGELNLPAPYGPISSTPESATQYYCRSGRSSDFIWEPWSVALARLILVACYGLAMVPLTLALASSSIAMSRALA